MNSQQISRSAYVTPRASLKQPFGVALVASFQMLKGAVLLVTAMALRYQPSAFETSQSVLYPLLYIAMRGNSAAVHAALQGGDVLPGLLFLLGSYLTMIGVGLWKMQSWARRSMMLTSGLTLLLWIKATLLAGDPVTDAAPPDLLYFHILISFDVMTFAYLLRGNTSKSFRTVT